MKWYAVNNNAIESEIQDAELNQVIETAKRQDCFPLKIESIEEIVEALKKCDVIWIGVVWNDGYYEYKQILIDDWIEGDDIQHVKDKAIEAGLSYIKVYRDDIR